MRYLKQFLIIITVAFIGEICKRLIPLPISASVYGIVLMFLCLELHIIKVSDIKETSAFLIEIMPVMFILAAAGLIDSWSLIRASWLSYVIISVLSTIIVMAVSGIITQMIADRQKGDTNDK